MLCVVAAVLGAAGVVVPPLQLATSKPPATSNAENVALDARSVKFTPVPSKTISVASEWMGKVLPTTRALSHKKFSREKRRAPQTATLFVLGR
jgi:hypothetical protein